MSILAIDPSVNHVGIALLQMGKYTAHTVHTDRGESMEMRASYVVRQIEKLLDEDQVVTCLVLEYPMFMQGTKGLIAAQRGYTIDLAYMCGLIAGLLTVHPLNVYRYTPQQWKGTKPKTATQAAFRRRFGANPSLRGLDEHAIDALMLLDFHCRK